MAPRIPDIFVKLRADGSELNKALDQLSGRFQAVGRRLSRVGGNLTAAVSLPLAGAAAGLVSVGDSIDRALDTIRTGTGATGRELQALGDDFRTVLREVPNAIGDVGTAIADLSTRLDVAGKPLQDLAVQVLNLSRVTKSDLGGVIASSSRVLLDWGAQIRGQASALDFLFRTAQATGIGIESLSRQLVQFGSPLRQVGFTFEEAAALIASFEREGVNAELVLGSLRIALGKLAQAGVTDTAAALDEIIARIREAGSVGEANALALEAFGARAGPDMAAAIREGRFAITELLSTLQGSDETINKAAGEAENFGDVMGRLRNRIALALEPLGRALLSAFESAQPALESVIDSVAGLVRGFGDLSPGAQRTAFAVLGLAAALGPVLLAFGQLLQTGAAISLLWPAITSPIGLTISALVGLAAAGAALVANWSKVRAVGTEIWSAIKEVVFDAVEGILRGVETLTRGIPVLGDTFRGVRREFEAFANESLARSNIRLRELEERLTKAGTEAASAGQGLGQMGRTLDELGKSISGGLGGGVDLGGLFGGSSEASKRAQLQERLLTRLERLTGDVVRVALREVDELEREWIAAFGNMADEADATLGGISPREAFARLRADLASGGALQEFVDEFDKLRDAGPSVESLASLDALAARLRTARDELEEGNARWREFDELLGDVQARAEALRLDSVVATAVDAFEGKLAGLREQLARGLIDREAFQAASTEAAEAFDQALIARVDELVAEGKGAEKVIRGILGLLKLARREESKGDDDRDKRLRQLREQARTIEESARAAVQLAEAFGLIGSEAARALQDVAQLGAAIPGILSGDPASILSGAGALASLVGGLVGESPEERALRAAMDELTEEVRKLRAGIKDVSALQRVPGAQFEGVVDALRTSLRPSRPIGVTGGPVIGPGILPDPDASLSDVQRLEQALERLGLSMDDVRAVADALGLPLVETEAGFRALLEGLESISLADLFRGASDQLALLRREFDLLDVPDLEQFERLRDLFLQLVDLPAELEAALAAVDLQAAGGLEGLDQVIADVFAGIRGGEITLGDLGVSPDLFFDFLSSLEGTGDRLGDLGDTAALVGDQLLNAPTGFRIALARFEASDPVADPRVAAGVAAAQPTGGPTASTSTVMNFQAGSIVIEGSGKSANQLYDEIVDESLRRRAAGGATLIDPNVRT